MQNKQTGQMNVFDTWDEVLEARKKNPESWGAIFRQGEKVKVINENGGRSLI